MPHCLGCQCHWQTCTASLHHPCRHELQHSTQAARSGSRGAASLTPTNDFEHFRALGGPVCLVLGVICAWNPDNFCPSKSAHRVKNCRYCIPQRETAAADTILVRTMAAPVQAASAELQSEKVCCCCHWPCCSAGRGLQGLSRCALGSCWHGNMCCCSSLCCCCRRRCCLSKCCSSDRSLPASAAAHTPAFFNRYPPSSAC